MLPANVRFFLAYRANYLPSLIKRVHQLGWGAEVSSAFEYSLAKALGAPTIIISGFDSTVYDRAVRDEAVQYVVIDSLDNADRLERAAKAAGTPVNIGLRVHPTLTTQESLASVQRGFKLGFDIADGTAPAAAERVARCEALNLVALNFHVANQQADSALHAAAVRSTLQFAMRLPARHRKTLRTLNIGGGLASRSHIDAEGGLARFAEGISGSLEGHEHEYEFVLEPGRYVSSDACIVATEVVGRKLNVNRQWLILDCGTNTLIPLASARFDVVPCKRPHSTTMTTSFDIGDLLSSPVGVIATNVTLPEDIAVGDLVAVLHAGAYTLSMAESFVLLRPAVVFVEGDSVSEIKRPEDVPSAIERLMSASW